MAAQGAEARMSWPYCVVNFEVHGKYTKISTVLGEESVALSRPVILVGGAMHTSREKKLSP